MPASLSVSSARDGARSEGGRETVGRESLLPDLLSLPERPDFYFGIFRPKEIRRESLLRDSDLARSFLATAL